MRNKTIKIIVGLLIVCAVIVLVRAKTRQAQAQDEIIKEIKPTFGAVENIISTTGSVLPRNRLEVKPPVNGRVDEILVKEGDHVKVGQPLAKMSSTERAALLDAARSEGKETMQYWQEAYKPILLISPIDGEVIVATTQAGQTVTTADAVIVLSDQLIVRAQVDETDIGKVQLNQSALITLDAYPDTEIKATVVHMYYESETVNNVTVYKVDLRPQDVPPFFRSGMNATINFIEASKNNALLVPAEAVMTDKGATYVLVKEAGSTGYATRKVTLGISDDRNVEVVSGLSESDIVILKTKQYSLSTAATGTNPFLPSRPKRK